MQRGKHEKIDNNNCPRNDGTSNTCPRHEDIEAKAYDLAEKYIGYPVREFDRVEEAYNRNKAIYGNEGIGDEFKAYNENNFVKETLLLIDVAVALDDAKAAKEIQAKALAILDDYRLRDADPIEKK